MYLIPYNGILPFIFIKPLCRHFNDRAVYTCDDGYQIVGVDKVTCNSNGQWNGVQPSCKKATSSTQSRYYCGAPPEMPNAKHNGTKEQVSSIYELLWTTKPGKV